MSLKAVDPKRLLTAHRLIEWINGHEGVEWVQMKAGHEKYVTLTPNQDINKEFRERHAAGLTG